MTWGGGGEQEWWEGQRQTSVHALGWAGFHTREDRLDGRKLDLLFVGGGVFRCLVSPPPPVLGFQGLVFARQVLFHLSHSTSPLCSGYSGARDCFLPRLA
jgi:hypothetical protein